MRTRESFATLIPVRELTPLLVVIVVVVGVE